MFYWAPNIIRVNMSRRLTMKTSISLLAQLWW